MTKLPNGWIWTTIGNVCDKPKYGWTTSAIRNGKIKLLRTTDLTHGPITWESVPYCKEVPKVVDDFEVHQNDIFISRAGSVGVSVLVKEVPEKTLFASYLIRLRPTEKIDAKFLALFLQSPHYWNQVVELSSGIALANINATKIQSMTLPLPPIDEQHKIVEILEGHLSRLDSAIEDVKQAKLKAAQFRRSLLQAAFSGNLVSDESQFKSELPDGWIQERFGDNFKVKYGKAIETSLRFDFAEFPVVGSAGVMTYTKIPLTIEPTIVIGRKGNVGSIQVFKNGCYPIDTTYYMAIPPEFEIDFLNYLLISLELFKLDSSTATPSLRREDLENVLLVIPPIVEQQKIVEVLEELLSWLDSSIDLADVLEKQSVGLRRSLLHSAFSGRLTGEVAGV